jgi:hypothetical protein
MALGFIKRALLAALNASPAAPQPVVLVQVINGTSVSPQATGTRSPGYADIDDPRHPRILRGTGPAAA